MIEGKEKQNNMDILPVLVKHLCLYEGCQNMLGIVPLTLAGYPDTTDFRSDKGLRQYLKDWGNVIKSDSVMVLTGDPKKVGEQGYHFNMFVFEPSGQSDSDLAGSISTMCGNGIRAVAAYTRKFIPEISSVKIMTMSGLRQVDIEDRLYVVNMGELTTKVDDLTSYVNKDIVKPNAQNEYIDSEIPEEIQLQLPKSLGLTHWSIGLTGDRNIDGRMDGEPHVVIEIPSSHAKSLEELRNIAVKYGSLITKNKRCFPQEINANFVLNLGKKDNKIQVLGCTHERNLGDDPDHSVTASCGTGSSVIGGVMFRRADKSISVAEIEGSGGILEITRKPDFQNRIFMKGPANECDKCW